jgi:hypothetical protein
VQAAWQDLMPSGAGVVNVQNPSKYSSLPIPLEGDAFVLLNKTAFTTSVAHQLHCLHITTGAFYTLVSDSQRKIPDDIMWHVPHCFDYIRQAIMCSGDMALEGSDPRFTGPEGSSQGWDAKHICKDFSEIKRHLESNAAFNISTI